MTDLREKIEAILIREFACSDGGKIANEILAIPEIAEALANTPDKYVEERLDSISKGARRTDHRFNLGHSIRVRDPD